MSKNGIRYTDDFKQQLVDLYNSGQPVLELSREYGVATVTIYKWIKQYSPVKVADNNEITAKKYQAMQKRIAELEMENEILKKATAIFARNGYGDGTFKPHGKITRQEMAVMTIRALEFTGETIDINNSEANLLSKFTDQSEIQTWSKQAVAKAVKASIINGRTESEFVPNGTATRAEAATMIKKLLEDINFIN